MRKFAIAAALTGLIIALVGIVSAGAAIRRPVAPASTLTLTVTPWTYYRGENFGEGTHGTVTSLCTPAGLHLVKAEATTGDSAAGATIGGVSGITLSELGFDLMAGGQFQDGPRFNVLTEDQQRHFYGLLLGASQVDGAPSGYQRYRWNPADPASDGATLGGTGDKKVLSIDVILDNSPNSNLGEATLKNFDVNGTIVNCTVAVVATPTPAPSATVAPSASAAPTATPAVTLAQTGGGMDVIWPNVLFGIALILILAGLVVAFVRRRRTS